MGIISDTSHSHRMPSSDLFTYSKNANREYMKVGFFNSGMKYFRKNVHVLYGIFKYLYGGFRSHGGYPQSSILDWDFP